MKTIIVTGGAGNIGSFIVDQLVELGHKVVVIDNFYNGKYKNIANHLKNKTIELEPIDIVSEEMVSYVFEKHKPELVCHQASLMIMDSNKFPQRAIDTNIRGTFNIIQASIKYNIKKIVFASSASVYGEPMYLPVDENHPFNNRTLYGATKIAKESLMNAWAYSHNLPFVGFRYFNIYSERQGLGAFYTQVFQKWIHAIYEDKEITIYGDGSQTLDLVHSYDAAKANILALFNDDIKYEYFNIGSGVETKLIELLSIIEKYLGKKAKIRFETSDPHLVKRRCSSIKKAETLLGFKPSIDVEEGTKRYVIHLLEGNINAL